MPGKWVVGGLINNVWSVGNESINSMLLQYFINYNLPGGSYITTSPIITSNWNAPDGNQWTVPFGIGAGKIVKLGGKLPLNLNASAYYNVVKPDYGADWTLRLQAVVLSNKCIRKEEISSTVIKNLYYGLEKIQPII